jgi:hypothetical protein
VRQERGQVISSNAEIWTFAPPRFDSDLKRSGGPFLIGVGPDVGELKLGGHLFDVAGVRPRD